MDQAARETSAREADPRQEKEVAEVVEAAGAAPTGVELRARESTQLAV